jgi:hypothetical protein
MRPGPRLEPGSGDPQSPRMTNYPTLAKYTRIDWFFRYKYITMLTEGFLAVLGWELCDPVCY